MPGVFKWTIIRRGPGSAGFTRTTRRAMKKARPVVAAIIALVVSGLGFTDSTFSQNGSNVARNPGLAPYQSAIGRIAKAIERLAPEYPQLAGFSARKHCDRARLVIEYDYKTRRAPRRGGWTAGVPEPAQDEIWFYIEFVD